MTNGRKELSQFILNEENRPFDCLLAAVSYYKMNAEAGPQLAAELMLVLDQGEKPWIY